MKRTCNGCRALERSFFDSEPRCTLGYKTESVRYKMSSDVDSKPLEECPKPKTYDKYLELAYGGKK